ncbi:hypothetical protein [Burkholderia gladioli]|uniref:hypothetical protein n=1 Tax=Burkholderia gladioli TaxID=28095 RepID=UPI00163F1B1D|nr:hypothetical protein [Burkholderia gladioli]
MSTPILDLSRAENIRRKLLDDDRGVRDAFAAALETGSTTWPSPWRPVLPDCRRFMPPRLS